MVGKVAFGKTVDTSVKNETTTMLGLGSLQWRQGIGSVHSVQSISRNSALTAYSCKAGWKWPLTTSPHVPHTSWSCT